jgi:hypothetical protein
MVSGYDKRPPKPAYSPTWGPGSGWAFVAGAAMATLLAMIIWLG